LVGFKEPTDKTTLDTGLGSRHFREILLKILNKH